LALVFLALVATTLAAHSYKHEFKKFQKKYNKNYATSEVAYRYQVFQDNMKKAEQLNALNPLARFGATKFSDLTAEEFAKFYLMPTKNFTRDYVQPPKKTDFSGVSKIGVDPDPTNFDWGSAGVVTPVYNQGQCGSCWAFSATETIESYFAVGGGPLTQLSMEQIVDCDTQGQDQGCNGGFPSGAYQYVQGAGGIDSYSSYPYTAEGGQSGSCQFSQSNVVTNVANYASVSGEDGLYKQMSSSSGGPVSVCVDASSWQNYQGGVLTQCTNNVDHCVQATGYYNYGQAFPGAYWNVRNSWGADWGQNGYIWVAIGQDLCSIGDYATTVSDNPPM
jgi:C1A family cysteine protease